VSLNFGAANSYVQFSVGNAANVSNGAVTMIALWKPGFPGGANTGLVGGQSSGAQRRSFLIDTAALFGDGDFTSGVAISGSAGDWLWLAMSKAAGSAHYRMHWKNFTTGGAWTHTEASGAANHSDPGVSNELRIGANAETSAATGDVAVGAIKLANMADLAIEAACTAALADLMAASPDWAVRFMNSAPSSIQDLTSGGGNETSRSGTVTNAADPSGFDFSLTSGITAVGQISTNRHPGRGPGVARFLQTPRSTEITSTQVASGAGTSSARTSTTSTGVRGAAGAAGPTARTASASAGVKKATGTAGPTARTSTVETGVKKGAGAATSTAHTATAAAAVANPGGPALPTAHTTATAAGKRGASDSAAPTAHTTTLATGKRAGQGAAAPSARTATVATGVKIATGAAVSTARTAVLAESAVEVQLKGKRSIGSRSTPRGIVTSGGEAAPIASRTVRRLA